MEKHQVIIAGAGPAGISCAKALKDEGINPLIVEKDKLPRHKICSGVLFGQTQMLLKKYFGQLPPKSVYCEPEIIEASDIKEWSPEKGFFKYPWELSKDGRSFSTNYLNIWRDKFDFWLLKLSEVDFAENCMVSGFSVENGKVTVEVLHKDEAGVDQKSKIKAGEKISCLYLIGADGSNSKVRRLIDSSWSKDFPRIIAYQSYMRFSDSGSLRDGSWNVFFEPEISDVLCSVHRKDEFITLCVGGFKGRNLKQSMEKFKNLLSENFKVVFEKEERWEGCVLRQAPVNLGNGRVILTGDAAGLMYLNGEGISAAIDSGYRAGKAVAKAIHKGIPALELYKEQSRDILTHLIMCYNKMHFFANL